jgi:hypothetical protein
MSASASSGNLDQSRARIRGLGSPSTSSQPAHASVASGASSAKQQAHPNFILSTGSMSSMQRHAHVTRQRMLAWRRSAIVLVLVFLGMGVLARVSLSGFTTSDAAREHELHQRWNDSQQNQGASSGGLRGTPK